jgi:hypothetical protein
MQSNLAQYAEGVSKASVDDGCSIVEGGLARVLIHENRLYVRQTCKNPEFVKPGGCFPTCFDYKGKPYEAFYLLLTMLCRSKVPNVEFLLNLGDDALANATLPYPVFSWAKPASQWDILLPYTSFNWVPWASQVADHPDLDDATWAAKSDIAFWRGSATGGTYSVDSWRNKTRTKLVRGCMARPDLCDAAIVDCIHCTAEAAAEMEAELGHHAHVPAEESFAHKYVVLVDGNSSPSSRSRFTFSQDSLVLFQETENFEFFYSGLRPYKHYVPLARGLEDLHAQIEWSRSHEREVKQIVRNAQQFAKRYFTLESITSYMYTVFSRYARLLLFVPEWTPDFEKGRIWLDDEQHEMFMGYMGNQCPHWINQPK